MAHGTTKGILSIGQHLSLSIIYHHVVILSSTTVYSIIFKIMLQHTLLLLYANQYHQQTLYS